MTASSDFVVTFWGVRGSVACPGPDHARYGGNTACLELRCGEHIIIFDAGTGMRGLGRKLQAEAPVEADILMTHTHLDHMAGLPFFAPFFDPQNAFRVWAGHLTIQARDLHTVLCQYMAEPLFPVPPQIFAAKMEWRDFRAGETLQLHDDLTVKTAPLNHPNGATGYRVEYKGRAFCFVTDTEHHEGRRDTNILELIRGADAMAYDCSFTEEEYPRFMNWGHSTWQEGLRLIEEADCKRLIVFHHDPMHDDVAMDKIAADVKAADPNALIATDGLVLEL